VNFPIRRNNNVRPQVTVLGAESMSMQRENAREATPLRRGATQVATVPGKTGELENELQVLLKLVQDAGGKNARILHTHFASPDAANVVFVQDAPDLAALARRANSPGHVGFDISAMDQESSAIASAITQPRNLFGDSLKRAAVAHSK
jgi:hypothetical protein